MATTRTKVAPRWSSRAAVRSVDAGSSTICIHCDEPIKFKAKIRQFQAICNVYIEGRWDRVEHFHAECYVSAGSPYGEPDV